MSALTPGGSANRNAPRRRQSRQPIKRRRHSTLLARLSRTRNVLLAPGLSSSGDSGQSPLPSREVHLKSLTHPRVLPERQRRVHGEGSGAGDAEVAGRQVQQWVPRGGASAARAKPARREAAATGEQERAAGGRLERRAASQRGGQRAEPPQPGGRLLVHPALAGRGPRAAGADQDALEGGHGHAVLHQRLPGNHLRSVCSLAGRRAGHGGGGRGKFPELLTLGGGSRMLALAEPRPRPWPSRPAKDRALGGAHFGRLESQRPLPPGPVCSRPRGVLPLPARSPLLQPGLAGPRSPSFLMPPGGNLNVQGRIPEERASGLREVMAS